MMSWDVQGELERCWRIVFGEFVDLDKTENPTSFKVGFPK
jgi:hypothetical protein